MPDANKEATLNAVSLNDLLPFVKTWLHTAKTNAKFFFDLCGCSMWTVNRILYDPAWKRCRFRSSINEPLQWAKLTPSFSYGLSGNSDLVAAKIINHTQCRCILSVFSHFTLKCTSTCPSKYNMSLVTLLHQLFDGHGDATCEQGFSNGNYPLMTVPKTQWP